MLLDVHDFLDTSHAKLLVSETFPGNATPPLGRCNSQGVGRCATEIAPCTGFCTGTAKEAV